MNSPRYLNSIEYSIDKQNSGIPAWDTYPEIERIKSESKIIIRYVINPDGLKEEAMDFAGIFDEQALVLNDEPIFAGPGFLHLIIYSIANQPVLKFIGESIAELGVQAIVLKGISKFIRLFRKSADVNQEAPLFIRIEGKNNSNLQFKFFSFFESEDIENALKVISGTLKEIGFVPGTGKILLFDTRRKKWFVVGHEKNE